MSYSEFAGVAFGSRKSGLSTVGYRLYNSDGSANGARVTAGIFETAPGTYGATVVFPDGFVGELRWDTGEGTPRYASVFVNPLSSAERSALANALLDLGAGVEANLTLRQALRGFTAVLLGKSSNGGDTFRDFNDTKDRISAVVDEDDNRVSVSRDLS